MSILLTLCLLQWTTGAPMPTPRHGFATAVLDGKVYAIGGFESPTVPSAVVEAYDIVADSWLTGFQRLPWPRGFAGCAVLSGKIYVIGGTDTRLPEMARVDRFDPLTDVWDTVAPIPWSAQALAACTFNNHIYVSGGFTPSMEGRYLKETARFVPSGGAGRWELVDSMNVPRASHGLAVTGDRMWAVGGKYYNPLQSVEYHESGHWYVESRQIRYPRSGLALVGYDGYLCATGGSGPHMQSNSVEVLNTRGGEWFQSVPMDRARVYHGAAVVGGQIIVLGGRDMHTNVAEVEHNQLITAVAEESVPAVRQAGLATVAPGRLSLHAGTDVWAVFDPAGRVVSSGRGAAELRFAPGTYFVRGVVYGELRIERAVVVR